MKNLCIALALLTAFFIGTGAVQAQALPHPTVALPDVSEWTRGGGTLSMSREPGGVRLALPDDAPWGNCYVEGDVDTEATPYLAILVTQVGRDAHWQLTVNDPDVHTLEGDGQDIGLRVFDLRNAPAKFQGRRHFRLYMTVVGAGKSVLVGGVGLFANAPGTLGADDAVSVPRWTRMNNSLATLLAGGGVNLAISEGATDQWGGLITKLPIDRARLPLIEAEVTELSPGTRWRLGGDGVLSGPEQRNCGTVAFNYADFSSVARSSDTEVQLTCTRVGGGQALRTSGVRFVPYPTASQELVQRTEAVGPALPVLSLLTTGSFQLGYDKEARLFRMERKGGAAALTTRFLEMPGFDLSPDAAPTVAATPTGSRLRYRVVRHDVVFDVVAETHNAVPGLLHWRVTATPKRPTRFRSCGHEVGYVSFAGVAPAGLQRITLQNLSASGLAYVSAPGLGNAFYYQNFTALNPVFQVCHTAPRWLVSAGNVTLGCANPLDTTVTWEAHKPVVLSDAYLCLDTRQMTPSGPERDNVAQAERFLTALATVYDALPDKPETEWYDWQQLARQSLHDLDAGDCWRAYGKRAYLQSYVGLRGAVPQLTSVQDLLAPLSWFHTQSGEGDSLVGKLIDSVPDFWSEEHQSLKEVALPGDHIWYNVPNLVTLSRAALAGDTALKPLCLKSADAMITLAHQTGYRFGTGPAGVLFGQPENAELAGPYLLYMMLAHELAPDDPRFLLEAKQAAATVTRWQYRDSRETFWTAMGCEGLARLYTATGDVAYVRTSYVPLASLLRNVFWWESDFGYARDYRTFCGMNSDASGIDYIAAMEQHQTWYALREYLRQTERVLPGGMQTLVAEFLRYAPATIWYAYPPHLSDDARFSGETFWKTDNNNRLQIPFEDVNTGWQRNGAVGQEIYGAGAAFTIASQAYTVVPEAGLLIFSEYPLRKVTWDARQKSLLLDVGGVDRYATKIELRPYRASGQGVSALLLRPGGVKAVYRKKTGKGSASVAVALGVKTLTIEENGEQVPVSRTRAPGNTLVGFLLGPADAKP